jgi:hypothetical protein
MQRLLNTEVYKTLPEDLQEIIIARAFESGKGEVFDKLWLFSEKELFGKNYYGKDDESDVHIPYYQNPTNRCKGIGAGGDANWWWARSPYAPTSATFCTVASGGAVSSHTASTAAGVCFGFCV